MSGHRIFEIFKTCLDTALGSQPWVALAEQGVGTSCPPEVPSHLNHPDSAGKAPARGASQGVRLHTGAASPGPCSGHRPEPPHRPPL